MDEASWISTSAAVRLLPDVAVIEVRGEDALSWLNGQLTCDLRELAVGAGHYGLVLNVKGRILADAWALGGDPLRVELPASRLDAVLEHFEKYIIMEDVELARTPLSVITVQGPLAAEVARAAGAEGFSCDRLGTGGLDIVTDHAGRAHEGLAAAARAVGGGVAGDAAWEIARLRAGRPAFGRDFSEVTYPQEAGLASWAVSFQKGCYLGQEVVCMLENRGQLTRRLVVLEAEAALEPGIELSFGSADVGQVTSAAEDGPVHRGLGYVKRAHAEPGQELTSKVGRVRVVDCVGQP